MAPPDGMTTLTPVRRLVYAAIGLGLVAILVIGVIQSDGGGPTENSLTSKAPGEAEVQRAFEGSPPALAALHRRANQLIPGGRDEYERQLEALRGHPVVVNVWGSWCGPCRLEFPSFQQQAVRFGKRVAFLGVNAKDNKAAAQSFLKEFPVTYPSVEDPDEEILGKLGGRGYPSTVYYDSKGEQVNNHQGLYTDDDALADDIRRYAR